MYVFDTKVAIHFGSGQKKKERVSQQKSGHTTAKREEARGTEKSKE